MPYRIDYTTNGLRELGKLPRDVLPRLKAAITALSDDPRPHRCRKLEGEDGLWRIRVGDYRVIYAIDDARRVVTVTRARNRRDAYGA